MTFLDPSESGVVHLRDAIRMVQAIWQELFRQYPLAHVDAIVVMPN